MRKKKVTFYMKSGNSFTVKFKTFSISRLTSNKEKREMRWEDPDVTGLTIDIDEIEAVIIK